jgi:RNase H-fold protein (predicted Holliday junction resolvase)
VVGSIEELIRVAKEEGAEKIILGLPEGKHQKKVRRLGKELEKGLGAEVVFRSEILSTGEALKRAIDSGKGKKARRELDSLAAAVLLQEYLDSEEN